MTDELGIDRQRTYTREEICHRFGYPLQPTTAQDRDNLQKFFKRHFLARGLAANRIGKTFEVAGDVYYTWTLEQSIQHDH